MAGGRWNPVGSPIVYAAWTFEGALLEQLVHASIGALPANRRAVEIHIPDDASVEFVDASETPGWDQESVSRRLGSEWLRSESSMALIVPSMVAQPWGFNVMLNPAHPEFSSVSVVDTVDIVWDPRFMR